MSDIRPDKPVQQDSQPAVELPSPAVSENGSTGSVTTRATLRTEARRWWIKLFAQPVLILVVGAMLIAALGIAQRVGIISSGGSGDHLRSTAATAGTRYICPMMCTPPQAEPGRCPVCAMELVPLTSGGGGGDQRSIHIDPATRRVANIRTATVTSMPMTRTLRAIGELNYDEGSLKTISAYVDGRLDRLYADYTGVVVKKDDHLALVYSPRLYTGQVELLLAKKSQQEGRASTLPRVAQSNQDLYASAKERLILFGMTEMQIEHLEEAGEANSQTHLCAPISGTVIKKMAVEGQYVKEGDAIYQLADLSTVWLMLKLFPEDAATIRYGQKVKAEVQSLPGREVTGRVAFIDPNVDPKTRTVGVRVVIPNIEGLLRVGDYAKATIDVPLSDTRQTLVFDPDLANKWISPRHPHIVAEEPGACRICGVDLVPAAQYGFTDQPIAIDNVLAVPRDAVLMAGNKSVVYVETVPGRFEIRRVVLGPSVGDQIVIRDGVVHGEHVATRGNFLIDSQMQLAGNPSLIDPSRLEPNADDAMSVEMIAALSTLSPEDRILVAKQGICPVAESQLGMMGTPQKVNVDGTPVFICCEACRRDLLSEPKKYMAKIASKPRVITQQDKAPATQPQMDLPPIGVPQIIPLEDEEPAKLNADDQEDSTAEPAKKRVSTLPAEGVR